MPDAGGGWFEGDAHVFPVRIYFEDTDAMGIVYYANYFKFAERARTEMIRAFGLSHTGLLGGDGVAVAVHKAVADFVSPAKLDDKLAVYTRVEEVRGASLRLSQTIRRDEVDLVRMRFKLACMTPGGRPARLPAGLKAVLDQFLTGNYRI